jgi:hypothetical protein
MKNNINNKINKIMSTDVCITHQNFFWKFNENDCFWKTLSLNIHRVGSNFGRLEKKNKF